MIRKRESQACFLIFCFSVLVQSGGKLSTLLLQLVSKGDTGSCPEKRYVCICCTLLPISLFEQTTQYFYFYNWLSPRLWWHGGLWWERDQAAVQLLPELYSRRGVFPYFQFPLLVISSPGPFQIHLVWWCARTRSHLKPVPCQFVVTGFNNTLLLYVTSKRLTNNVFIHAVNRGCLGR